jgi:hypothetical protein
MHALLHEDGDEMPRHPPPPPPPPLPPVNDPIAERIVECIMWAYGKFAVGLHISAHWLKRFVVAHVHRLISSSSSRGPPGAPFITKVYAFSDDDPPSIEDEPDWTDFYVIPANEFVLETWETDLKNKTGWTTFHVEVRYVYMDKKYRTILRQGDDITTTLLRQSDDISRRPDISTGRTRMRLPRGVLSARLVMRDDLCENAADVDVDVTSRIKKYSGPHGNFKHASVHVRDVFPFDDHESNAERYAGIRIIDAWGRTKFFSYIDNDRIDIDSSYPGITPTGDRKKVQ